MYFVLLIDIWDDPCRATNCPRRNMEKCNKVPLVRMAIRTRRLFHYTEYEHAVKRKDTIFGARAIRLHYWVRARDLAWLVPAARQSANRSCIFPVIRSRKT